VGFVNSVISNTKTVTNRLINPSWMPVQRGVRSQGVGEKANPHQGNGAQF
jgi:hypothetical protein